MSTDNLTAHSEHNNHACSEQIVTKQDAMESTQINEINEINSALLNTQPFMPSSFSYAKWTDSWVIKTSKGHTKIIKQLLQDIEEILGTEPQISFLRIIEEHQDDELFIRELRIFIDHENLQEAQEEALSYACTQLRKRSAYTCFICGTALKTRSFDEDSKSEFSVLSNFFEFREFPTHYMHWCTCCIETGSSQHDDNDDTELDISTNTTYDHSNKEITNPKNKPDLSKITHVDSKDSTGNTKQQINKFDLDENTISSNKIQSDPDINKLPDSQVTPIFQMSDVDQMEKDYQGATREQANRIKGLVKRIRKVTTQNRLASIPENWHKFFEQLLLSFPNFTEVIIFIRNQLALAINGNKVLHLPSFLLIGDAGIGKTEFLLTLTQFFNTPLEIIDVASLQSESTLAGSENFWGNTKPSLLFNTLIFGDTANPIIMLDEIDKAKTNSAYNPLAALHMLLEPRQAKNYKDLSVPEIKLDASHIIWVATANNLEAIEKPIADRFIVFTIKKPDITQMQIIVKNLYQRITQEKAWGVFFNDSVSVEVVTELCKHHPRKVRKLLEQSFGHAAFKNRTYLTQGDIQACLTNEIKTVPMGFM